MASLLLTGLRGFVLCSCATRGSCFAPVSRDEADSREKRLGTPHVRGMRPLGVRWRAARIREDGLNRRRVSWCRSVGVRLWFVRPDRPANVTAPGTIVIDKYNLYAYGISTASRHNESHR